MSEVKIIKKIEPIYYGGFKPEGAPDFTTVDYVLHSDYEKIKAQLERAEKVIQHYVDLFGDRYGGKEAREYFKEK